MIACWTLVLLLAVTASASSKGEYLSRIQSLYKRDVFNQAHEIVTTDLNADNSISNCLSELYPGPYLTWGVPIAFFGSYRLSDFNVFAFDSFTSSNANIGGRVAARNSITAETTTIALQLSNAALASRAYSTVTDGTLDWEGTSADLQENIFADGTVIESPSGATVDSCTFGFFGVCLEPAFKLADAYYTITSAELAWSSNNTFYTLTHTNALIIRKSNAGDDATRYIINIQVRDWNQATQIILEKFEPNCEFIINLLGFEPVVKLAVPFPATKGSRTLFNIHPWGIDVNNIVVEVTTDVMGSILVPWGSINQTAGTTISGQVIANSVLLAGNVEPPKCNSGGNIWTVGCTASDPDDLSTVIGNSALACYDEIRFCPGANSNAQPVTIDKDGITLRGCSDASCSNPPSEGTCDFNINPPQSTYMYSAGGLVITANDVTIKDLTFSGTGTAITATGARNLDVQYVDIVPQGLTTEEFAIAAFEKDQPDNANHLHSDYLNLYCIHINNMGNGAGGIYVGPELDAQGAIVRENAFACSVKMTLVAIDAASVAYDFPANKQADTVGIPKGCVILGNVLGLEVTLLRCENTNAVGFHMRGVHDATLDRVSMNTVPYGMYIGYDASFKSSSHVNISQALLNTDFGIETENVQVLNVEYSEVHAASMNGALKISGGHNITINTLRTTGQASSTFGIEGDSISNILIQNSFVSTFGGGAGIGLSNTLSAIIDNNEITMTQDAIKLTNVRAASVKRNSISEASADAIFFQGSSTQHSVLIAFNTIATIANSAIKVLSQGSSKIIRNRISSVVGTPIETNAAIFVETSQPSIVSYNEIDDVSAGVGIKLLSTADGVSHHAKLTNNNIASTRNAIFVGSKFNGLLASENEIDQTDETSIIVCATNTIWKDNTVTNNQAVCAFSDGSVSPDETMLENNDFASFCSTGCI